MLIAKLVVAGITLIFGVWVIFAPRKALTLIGMSAEGPRGITETRVALGAIYVGSGLACLVLHEPAAFITLGLAYLVMALVRAVAIVVDRSADGSNWASLGLEGLLGMVLMV
jgi:hypothetical protein